MLSRNLLLIGIIVGCMLLVLYSSYYGTIMSKRMTEGFSTMGFPIHLYFVDDEFVYNGETIYSGDGQDANERYRNLGLLKQKLEENSNVKVNMFTIGWKDDQNPTQMINTVTNQNDSGYNFKQHLDFQAIEHETNKDVYHIYVLPVLGGKGNKYTIQDQGTNIYYGNYYMNSQNQLTKSTITIESIVTYMLGNYSEKPLTNNDNNDNTNTNTTNNDNTNTNTTNNDNTNTTNNDNTNTTNNDNTNTNTNTDTNTNTNTNTSIPTTITLNVQGIPETIKHNFTHSGGISLTHLEDYDSKKLSENSVFTTPEITSSNSNAVSSVGIKFVTGVLGGLFSN